MRRFERILSRLARAGDVPGPAHEPAPERGAEPQVSAPADPLEEFAWLDLDDPLGLPRIVSTRAGVYLITDSKGRRLGMIRGDFGIGFTVRYRQMSGWYPDLDEASAAIATEAVGGRPDGAVSAAS